LVVAEPSVADFEPGVLEHWLKQPGERGVFVADDSGGFADVVVGLFGLAFGV
jgi:hypothetical protein